MSKSKGLREQVCLYQCDSGRLALSTSCCCEMAMPTTEYHTHLQNLETLDVSALTPLTPDVISRQATINIGVHICAHSPPTHHLNRHHRPRGPR